MFSTDIQNKKNKKLEAKKAKEHPENEQMLYVFNIICIQKGF